MYRILSASTASMTIQCVVHGNERVVNLADVVAGVGPTSGADGMVRADPRAICLAAHVPEDCPQDAETGLSEHTHLVRANSFFASAFAVNGVHRFLVGAGRMHPDCTATLEAELVADPDPRPAWFHELTADSRAIAYKADGHPSINLAALLDLVTLDTARAWTLDGRIWTADADEDVGAFLNAIFPTDAQARDFWSDELRTRRALHFPPP